MVLVSIKPWSSLRLTGAPLASNPVLVVVLTTTELSLLEDPLSKARRVTLDGRIANYGIYIYIFKLIASGVWTVAWEMVCDGEISQALKHNEGSGSKQTQRGFTIVAIANY